VVRALVRLHGGEVVASSAGAGRGTEFAVRLPAVLDAVGLIAESHAASVEAPLPPRHILIVEDSDDNRESLQELLESEGHRVDTAMDGEQGVERAIAAHPEVALVDIGLPRLDGYEVARRIRAAGGSDIFLVALTGYGQPEDRTRAAAAGFDVHITKPLNFGHLREILSAAATKSSPPTAAVATPG
jgi:CheY-like chemotaxis protein